MEVDGSGRRPLLRDLLVGIRLSLGG